MKPKIKVVNTNNEIMKKPQIAWRLDLNKPTKSTYEKYCNKYSDSFDDGFRCAVKEFLKDLDYIEKITMQNHVFIRLQEIKDKWELSVPKVSASQKE